MVFSNDIGSIIKDARGGRSAVLSALGKAGTTSGLSLEDASLLLNATEPDLLDRIYQKAAEVKERVYGKRVVLFAPLYLSNYCTNGCVYCGFRSTNTGAHRKALSMEEAVDEARTLERMGFKRVLLVLGEDKRWGLEYLTSCVKAIYENTGIRIIHVNAPPMDTEGLRRLKSAGVGVYQSFQETYHRETYEKVHPSGKKRDYGFRLSVMDRAIEAGFEDVGIGPLLGLYDYRYDCLAAIAHSNHLYLKYGAHAHTVSVPRLRPAQGGPPAHESYPVTDEDLKKIVSVLRLAVPTAGVVVSTRESRELRNALMHIGATQLSAASRTNPGGYAEGVASLEQFSTNDHRTLEEVMESVVREGFVPSLCTTCYRVGRVGHSFTEKTAAGEMARLCQANSILTLKEYIAEHSKNGKSAMFEKTVADAVDGIEDPVMKKAVMEKLAEIEAGKRDVFF